MPKKGYKQTKEHKEKIGKTSLGRKHTLKFKFQISKRMQGKKNPNYGKKASVKTRLKMGKCHKGFKHSEKTKRKIKLSNIRFHKKHPNITKGKNSSFYGKHHTKKTIKKIRNSKYHKNLKGKNNPNFGNHKLLGKIYKPERHKKHYCIEECGREICYYNWKYGKQRCNSCSHKGKLSVFYIHGNGNEPYSLAFSDILKEEIRIRDNHICQLCEKNESNNMNNGKQEKLCIHHIDYNKQNCNKENLISLCRKCNVSVNHNIDYWYACFTYVMELKK